MRLTKSDIYVLQYTIGKCQTLSDAKFGGIIPFIELCEHQTNKIIISMKHKILFMAALAAAAAIAFICHSRADQQPASDEIMLRNIEALADDEDDSYIRCAGVGCLDCPISEQKVKYIIESYSVK